MSNNKIRLSNKEFQKLFETLEKPTNMKMLVNHGKPWTPDTFDQLHQLLANNKSSLEISMEMKRSEKSVICATKKHISNLLKSGISEAQIVNDLHCDIKYINEVKKRTDKNNMEDINIRLSNIEIKIDKILNIISNIH